MFGGGSWSRGGWRDRERRVVCLVHRAGSEDGVVSYRPRHRKVYTHTYHHGAFAPTTVPVTGDVSDPIALSPNARPDTDLGVQLHAHLEVAFKDGFGDRKGARGR